MTTERILRCRMLNATNDRCTAEAVDPNGEVLICVRHAGLVLELVRAAEVVRELLGDEREQLNEEHLLLNEERIRLAEVMEGVQR